MCVCVCLSVCPSVNKMPIERRHRFGIGFRKTVAYSTGSDPNEIGDFGSKVKVTMKQNVSKDDNENLRNIQMKKNFNESLSFDRNLIPNMTILN